MGNTTARPESEIRHTGRHEIEAEAEDRAAARRSARLRVHFWGGTGDRAWCGTPGYGSDLVISEDPDDVSCQRCQRKIVGRAGGSHPV